MSRLQVRYASRNRKLHPLDRIMRLGRQREEVRADGAHGSDCLQYTVVVHRLDGQAHRCQVEVPTHDLRPDL